MPVWSSRIATNLATQVYRKCSPQALALLSLPEYALKYQGYRAVEAVNEGFEDHSPQEITFYERGVIFRILTAYLKAKERQMSVSPPYQVGHLWQEILDKMFVKLIKACQNKDVIELQILLRNFNREKFGEDTCGGHLFYHRMKTAPLYKYQFINAWYKRYNACKDALGYPPELSHPNIGNPVGMQLNGQTIPLTSIEYYYYAIQMHRLLYDKLTPVVCEIGGGTGGQAYMALRHVSPEMTYILLDIPEVLLVSSYFLMMAYPKKRFLLYGEASIGELDNYDVALMPNFVLPRLKSRSVDLFFNSCSFSEMNSITAREYLSQIERICGKYLYHNNHNARLIWWENGRQITNLIADEVKPNPVEFRIRYKRPRLFELLEDTFVIHLFYRAQYFTYLYERK